jgi:hypothetical protein
MVVAPPGSWQAELTGAGRAAQRIFKDAIIDRQLDADHAAEEPVDEQDLGGRGGPGAGDGSQSGDDTRGNGSGGSGGTGGSAGTDGPGDFGDPGGTGDGGSGADPGPGADDTDPIGADDLPAETAPEPATLVLLATGVAGVVLVRTRRKQ